MNLTLRQLSYFKALADYGSFGRAADSCRVSQPALSMQIREMEGILGAPVVERQARRVVLTPFGRRILDHAELILEQMHRLEEAARWREGLAGRLAIGVIPTVAPYILPDLLARLRASDIALDVQVQEAKTARLMSDLMAGRLDAAILALPSGAQDVVELPLFEDRFLLAGTEGRIKAIGAAAETLRPTEIGASQLLLLEDGHCLTDQALEVCGRGRGHSQINMGASSLATLSRLVAAGFGLTLMPEIALPNDGADLSLLRFADPEPSRTIGLVRRASSPAGRWFEALADLATDAGRDVVDRARSIVPPSGGVSV